MQWDQLFKCKYREKARLYRKKAIEYGEQKERMFNHKLFYEE